MSQIKLLLCAALISFMFINDSVVWGRYRSQSIGYSSSGSHSIFRRSYEGREYNNSRQTSCGVGLCLYSPSYPYSAINDTVNQYRLIREDYLSKTYPRENQYKFIDSAVLQYRVLYTTPASGFGVRDGCRYIMNTTQPLEGISVDDNRAYYIVNIPSFEQWEYMTFCNPAPNSPKGKCRYPRTRCEQAYRTRKLLALPADRKQFDVSDLKIKTFQLPDDCECRNYNDDNEDKNNSG